MFAIDDNGDLIGYSRWDFDLSYQPLVGCYADGKLIVITACDRAPEGTRLRGPRSHCWFRLPVEHEIRNRLVAGDPAVKVLRTEDAVPIEMSDGPEPRPLRRVEDFLTSASRRRSDLTGYPAFLRAPRTHQLDILFMDFLGRLPDSGARRHYLDQMNRGKSLFAIRDDLLVSEEFRHRKLTVSDRPGSLVTSPLWWLFADADALGEDRPHVTAFRLTDYEDLSDQEFLNAMLAACFGEEPPRAQRDQLEGFCREEGRFVAASYLVRIAAENGRVIHVS